MKTRVVNAFGFRERSGFLAHQPRYGFEEQRQDKPYPAFAYYPERDFRDSFVDISNLFIDQKRRIDGLSF